MMPDKFGGSLKPSETPRIITITSYCDPWKANCSPELADLVEQTKDLYLTGYVRAAGCLARQALEVILRKLCELSDLIPKSLAASETEVPGDQYIGLASLLTMAAPTLQVDPEFLRQASLAIAIGNACCHAQETSVGRVQALIEVMISLQGILGKRQLKATIRLKQLASGDQPAGIKQIGCGIVVAGTIMDVTPLMFRPAA